MSTKLLLSLLRLQETLRSHFRRSEAGQNTTEYGIFIAGVIVVVLVVVGIFSGALRSLWTRVSELIAGG